MTGQDSGEKRLVRGEKWREGGGDSHGHNGLSFVVMKMFSSQL